MPARDARSRGRASTRTPRPADRDRRTGDRRVIDPRLSGRRLAFWPTPGPCVVVVHPAASEDMGTERSRSGRSSMAQPPDRQACSTSCTAPFASPSLLAMILFEKYGRALPAIPALSARGHRLEPVDHFTNKDDARCRAAGFRMSHSRGDKNPKSRGL